MLLAAWTFLGHLALGLFVGGVWAILVMIHWASLMDRNGWTGVTAPDWLFAAHVVVAVTGGASLGVRAFRWSRRVVDKHDAGVLRQLWIDGALAGTPRRLAVGRHQEIRDAGRQVTVPLPAPAKALVRGRRPPRMPGLLFVFGILFVVTLVGRVWSAAAVFGAALVWAGTPPSRPTREKDAIQR